MLIDDDEIIEYISENYEPDDVFDEDTLETWALSNGFVAEPDDLD